MSDMLTMKEYLESAEKAICEWGHPDMLKSEDAIANIASVMMKADQKFNGKGTRNGFRMSYAKFAILNEIRAYKARKNHLSFDYDSEDGDRLLFDSSSWQKDDVVDNVINRELIESLDSSQIPKRDLDILKEKYLKDMTMEEIGKKYNLTKERIRQILDKTSIRAYQYLKEEYGY